MAEAADLPQLARLNAVITALRTPGTGCPWDLEQTEHSMAPHLLEEAYEALEAIERDDPQATCEELGDVLMNVFLIARIAEQAGRFDLEAVAATVADKLVRRHPHVFGDVAVDGAAQVLANWEAIKQTERRGASGGKPAGVLDGVPGALPALLKALRVGEKAARVGFDWPDRSGPRAKLDEELGELDAALAAGDDRAVEAEMGDVLFSLANLARHCGVNPELALRRATDRFIARFRHVEQSIGGRFDGASPERLEELWQQAKDRAPQ